MKRFFYLLKRKLTRELTEGEEEELRRLLNSNEELNTIYTNIFPNNIQEDGDWLDAEQAYAVHYAKMQLSSHFDEGL